MFLAMLEQYLFRKQLRILECSTNNTYKCQPFAQEILALFYQINKYTWRGSFVFENTINDSDDIDSYHIVGVSFDFSNNDPLFISYVYLPTSSHNIGALTIS